MNRQNIGKGILIIIEALLLCAVLVLGILTMMVGEVSDITDNKKPQWNSGTSNNSEADTSEEEQTNTYTEVRLTFSAEVEEKLSSMTMEEKVAQLFLISPESLTGVDRVTISGNGTKTALQQYPVAGLIYDADNFMGEEQTKLLISNAQGYCQERIGLPLFMAVEEEGGNKSPLAIQNLYEVTQSPGELSVFADAGMVTSEVGARMEYLTKNGFNMVLGPMANLATGSDPYVDDRTYGKDGTIAATLIAADVTATNVSDVAGVLRYFPRVEDESDFDKVTEAQISVFQSAIDAGAKVIMVSHGKAASVSGDETLPCSLAAGTVATIRGKMGYEGMLMTAPMNDETITSVYGSGDAAVKAIVAGMDMIYEPASFVEAYDAVIEAVNNGTISQMRLENAVGKVLEMKMK